MKVPLIISGDIFTIEDAKHAVEITKATAVMVARGGVGNPNLVRQINTYYNNEEIPPESSLDESVKYLYQLTDMMIAEKGEQKAMMILRGIAPKFFGNFPNSKKLKSELAQTLKTRADLKRIIEKYIPQE